MRSLWPLLVLVFATGHAQPAAEAARDEESAGTLITTDRFVAHESTVPANRGERVGLFVREKLAPETGQAIRAGRGIDGRVVLFVHGVSVSSIPDFDLDFRDYSWMSYLASAGFDTFAMDQSGYGHSPQPTMANPCNLADEDMALLDEDAVRGCTRDYSSQLTSSQTDWDEIDSVVDFIRDLRGVDRVSLIGWSLGGLRAGGYAARHADKIEKLVLFAPFYQRASPEAPPEGFPIAGAPMTLQTETALMQDRWLSNVACEDQVAPGIQDRVWQTIMAYDSRGSVWSLPRGVMRVRSASYWGFNRDHAAAIEAPTLVLVGLQDGLLSGATSLYEDIGATEAKVLVRMECATHFAVWEASQYAFMHRASLEWLRDGTYRGVRSGQHRVGFGGIAID